MFARFSGLINICYIYSLYLDPTIFYDSLNAEWETIMFLIFLEHYFIASLLEKNCISSMKLAKRVYINGTK